MGGHHEPYKVPDPSIYNIVDEVPKLKQVKDALARQGLRDPWLRNEVWRYDPKMHGTQNQRLIKFLFRGFPLGFAAFLVTIGVEYALAKGGDDHHGHENHGDEH